MNRVRGLMRRCVLVAAAVALAVLAADWAAAGCCGCTSDGMPCPSGAQACFTVDATDIFPCISGCPNSGCGGINPDGSAVCGQGAFAGCATIDGVPVSTKTSTATATATATSTGTATNTATATATATSTATATGTVTNTPTATPVPQGGGCSVTSQCVAGLFCADGVCCDTACDGPLQQCNLPGQVGTCASNAAAAPAASNTGLLAMLGVLVGAAFVALRWRRL